MAALTAVLQRECEYADKGSKQGKKKTKWYIICGFK